MQLPPRNLHNPCRNSCMTTSMKLDWLCVKWVYFYNLCPHPTLRNHLSLLPIDIYSSDNFYCGCGILLMQWCQLRLNKNHIQQAKEWQLRYVQWSVTFPLVDWNALWLQVWWSLMEQHVSWKMNEQCKWQNIIMLIPRMECSLSIWFINVRVLTWKLFGHCQTRIMA